MPFYARFQGWPPNRFYSRTYMKKVWFQVYPIFRWGTHSCVFIFAPHAVL